MLEFLEDAAVELELAVAWHDAPTKIRPTLTMARRPKDPKDPTDVDDGKAPEAGATRDGGCPI